MQHNHPLIAYAYHFLSEAILIFMITIPVFYHRFFFVPYGSYLAVIAAACILFSILTKLKAHLKVNIVVAPILFIVFSLLDYPFVFSALFSVFLVWSYINIRKQEVINREALYILLTVFATVIVSIFVHDSQIMMFPFLQFVLLFFGYIASHMVHVVKEDRKQIDRKIPGYFAGLLIIGAGLFFIAFPLLRQITVKIWQGFINLAGDVILGVSNFLSFFEVEKRGWPEQTPEEAKHGDGYWDELQEYNVLEEMSGLLVMGVILVLLFVFALIIINYIRKQVKNRLINVDVELAEKKSPIPIHREAIVENESKSIFKRRKKEPNNPIRKMVFQFERKATKFNKGRKSHETIEDWFKRIGVEADINIYQRVRYGDRKVSENEQQALKSQLKSMEQVISVK
ncbi:hypothetical protein [Ornithinibacillus californiensis]|uniref:hypothetical protein n=1 Tax=Ornithinibacillus californiensis TaxID=161536 RepID=UPI00064E0D52|nr:hypothetical protein [Ornithinibacillus californiensis]